MDNKEIAKYIFDPSNPNQCKAYNLLIKISKKKPPVFISPDMLKYMLGKLFISDTIKNDLWDIPDNFNELSIDKQFALYEKQYSKKELEEFLYKEIDKRKPLFKYSFFDTFLRIYQASFSLQFSLVSNDDDIKKEVKRIILKKDNFASYNSSYIYKQRLEHTIFITNTFFEFVHFDIEKSSIVITLLENAETFYQKNKNSNIKPIFLQKIDDLELLLNVLENDLKRTDKKVDTNDIALLNSVKIKNFYSIKNVDINLYGNKEVYIVGENGDGKSLLLQAITIGLVGVNEGEVFDLVKSQKEFSVKVQDTKGCSYTKDSGNYKYILAYGASRYSFCQIKEDKSGYLSLFSSSYDLTDPVEWLQYLDHKEKSKEYNTITLQEIKNILINILNKDIDIIVTADSVEFIEKGSSVSFEQLSSGYRGVITMVCDIISKMYQKEPNVSCVSDFGGVVFIDEVDLHLHPKWKYRFIKKLREIFPNIQFIVTTHSISVVSGASREALFLRTQKIDGNIVVNEIEDIAIDYIADIQKSIFDFDINVVKIEEPHNQNKAKKSLLDMLRNVEDEK